MWLLLQLVVDVYFIIDIFLNFRTSYYTSDGTREDRPDKIAKAYLKGWFTIDFLSCLPLGYVGYFFQDNGTASAATAGSMAVAADGAKGDSTIRLLKVLRLVRLSKMLRLARLERLVGKYGQGAPPQMYTLELGTGIIL